MEKKKCFGSIQEIIFKDDLTMIQATFGCRDCLDFKECLQYVKERDELRKQNMIAKIIDLSELHSNEIGACLLECLSRIYGSPLGIALFKSLLLFYEIPKNRLSYTLNIPISPSVMDLVLGEETEVFPDDGFMIRIVLIHMYFPDNRKANMGFLAYEVARVFASDKQGTDQILRVLSDSEAKSFSKMDIPQRTNWLIDRWGFKEEFEAFRKEIGALKTPKGE